MRLPKGFKIISETADSKHIIIENYDGNFLAFQIIVLAVPLLIATVLLAGSFGSAFLIVFSLLLAVVYWCLYNYKDQTQFIFTADYFIVKEGMHQIVKLKVHKNNVVAIELESKSGRIFTSPRLGSQTKTKPKYEVYIVTNDETLLVTKHVGHAGQVFLKETIEKWMKKE